MQSRARSAQCSKTAHLKEAKKLRYQAPARPVVFEESSDSELVGRFIMGEDRSFTALVERYQGRLLNFIYRTIGDRERAEDLVQEVFMRVHKHIEHFDQKKKFSTWAYTIASNLAKNELRNRSRDHLVLFQTLRSKWENPDGPLQYEDVRARANGFRRHYRAARLAASPQPGAPLPRAPFLSHSSPKLVLKNMNPIRDHMVKKYYRLCFNYGRVNASYL